MDFDKFIELIFQVSKSNVSNILRLADNISYSPGGENGPYFDIETPVRNTSHWCVTYSILSKRYPDEGFEQLANSLANYLISPSKYKKYGVYVHRQKHGKDWSNGVIGQSWVIEALAIGGRILEREDLTSHAKKAASKFPFDTKVCAWKRIDPRTGKSAIDYTLNHQLWYAAALAELDDPTHNANISRFLTLLNRGAMRTDGEGRVLHLLYSKSIKGLILRARYAITRIRNGNSLKAKEIGYHLYNLHPLARLKKGFGDHELFQSSVVEIALEYTKTDAFFNDLDSNKYSYPYNSPAFELSLVKAAFKVDIPLERFVDRQLEKTYWEQDGNLSFYRGCPDPMTLNARVYEALIF